MAEVWDDLSLCDVSEPMVFFIGYANFYSHKIFLLIHQLEDPSKSDLVF